MEKKLYIFSGLGADERVFQRLDFSGYSTTFVKWIVPQGEETIEAYTTRLLEQVTTTRPILIGLSFGGLIAVEVAKRMETEKVILIASAKTKQEIPFYYRWAGQMGLHRLLPTRLLKTPNMISDWFFGVSSAGDQKILKQILLDTDPVFLRWAIGQVTCWANETKPNNLFHIHGTSDRILPLSFLKCNATIQNGGHLMTLDQASTLSKIIRQELA